MHSSTAKKKLTDYIKAHHPDPQGVLAKLDFANFRSGTRAQYEPYYEEAKAAKAAKERLERKRETAHAALKRTEPAVAPQYAGRFERATQELKRLAGDRDYVEVQLKWKYRARIEGKEDKVRLGPDGQPVMMPASARALFDKKTGRIVYDGHMGDVYKKELTELRWLPSGQVVPEVLEWVTYDKMLQRDWYPNIQLQEVHDFHMAAVNPQGDPLFDMRLAATGAAVEELLAENRAWYHTWNFGEDKSAGFRNARKGALLTKIAPKDKKITGDRNQCVIDGVLHVLCQQKRNCERYKTALGRQKLISELGSANPSLKDLQKWCAKKNISLYAMDAFGKTIVRAPQQNKLFSLFVMINDEHMYLITETELRRHIVNNSRIDTNVIAPEITPHNFKVVAMHEELPKDAPVVLVDSPDISDIAAKIITDTGCAITNMNADGASLTAFLHPVTSQGILAAPDYHERKAACVKLFEATGNLEFTWANQSYTNLARTYCRIKLGDVGDSVYGPALADILTNQGLGAYIDTAPHPDEPDRMMTTEEALILAESPDAQSVDWYRCYSSILALADSDWPVFTQFDSVQPCVDEPEKPGLYFINKPFEMAGGYTWFDAGWYPLPTVQYCLKRKYITQADVTHQLCATKYLPADTFRSVVEGIYDIVGAGVAKHLVNNLVGWFGKIWQRAYAAAITTSEPTAMAHWESYRKRGQDVQVSKLGEYFLMKLETRKQLYSGKAPLHRQVIGLSYIWLDRMVRKVCGPDTVPIAFNTDSFKALRMRSIEFPDKPDFGDMRKEASVNVRARASKRRSGRVPQYEYNEHPDFTGKLGAFVTGPAGSGKTERLKQIWRESREAKKNVAVLAPTNIAVINLKSRGVDSACTIDKFFDTVSGVTKKADLVKKLESVDIVLVDEYSQVNYRWWHIFMQAKMRNRKLRVYVFGDVNQCVPVEDYLADVAGSDLMKFLTDGNHEELAYIAATGRYTQATYDALQELLTKGEWSHLQEHFPDAVFNITATNARRRELNEKCAEEFLKKPGVAAFEIGRRELAVGLPVICYENNDFAFNSQSFVIREITDKAITIGPNPVLSAGAKQKTVDVPRYMFERKCAMARENYVFELGFASTVNKVQGLTIHGKYNVHEARKMSRNNLYTAISRCRDLSQVAVPAVRSEYTEVAYDDDIEVRISPSRMRGVVYCLTVGAAENNPTEWYIGQTEQKRKESAQEAAVRRLKEHREKPTNERMKEWLKLNGAAVQVTVLRSGRVLSERTLRDLETSEIRARFAGNEQCLNSYKVSKAGQDWSQGSPAAASIAVVDEMVRDAAEVLAAKAEAKAEAVAAAQNQRDAETEKIRKKTQQRRLHDEFSQFCERGIITEYDDRFGVRWYEDGRKKCERFKNTRDYYGAMQKAVELARAVCE